jgi:hypothetical protein
MPVPLKEKFSVRFPEEFEEPSGVEFAVPEKSVWEASPLANAVPASELL